MSQNTGEKADGEVKNNLCVVNEHLGLDGDEENHPEISMKQNGMSDHSEIKTNIENVGRNDSSNNSENPETVTEHTPNESVKTVSDDFMNNANGETEEYNSASVNSSKEGKANESFNIEKEVVDRVDRCQSNSHLNNEQDLDNRKNEVESEVKDQEQAKMEHTVNCEKSPDSASVDGKKSNSVEKIEHSSVHGPDSEDSSEDSLDSSISNVSETSLAKKEKEDNDLSITDPTKERDGADIDSETNHFEKEEEEVTEGGSKSTSLETDKENVSDSNDKIVADDKCKIEKEPDEKSSDVTVDKSENFANIPVNAGVKQTVLQQTTVPYIVPISSVPYVVTQQSMTVHQQQTGYITKVGSQHIFVPMSGAASLAGASMYPVVSAAKTLLSTSQAAVKPAAAAANEKPPELAPKSSLEMIELMKWEIQNRVPDNYNWSVAFHPKKDELSSISAFLLELGHDVVKEAVYKDIIMIQTKKKEQGILKETEIESLEKMKTVYENTKKKVEHLETKMFNCKHCKFQTESMVVMNHHKDHPHIEPPWDWQNGYLCCAKCDFRTKQTAAFSFHMEAVHNAVAKMPEKPGQFPCEMCPLDLSTKNKLAKHRVKCMKTFKLNVNLQPYYHDVNFCMKTCYYKPKKQLQKLAPKKVDPKQQAQRQQLSKSAAQVGGVNASQVIGMRQTLMQPQFVPRAPPPLQRQPVSITPIIRAPQTAYRQASPQMSRTPVVRQMIQQQKQSTTASTVPNRPQSKEMSGFEVCELCGGYVKDRQALRIHFYYAHKVEMPQTIFNRPTPPLTCDVCQSKFWTTQGLSKHKSTLRHYSNSNSTAKASPPNHKCFMCNRMVTNLFIHVEQSHGMTMKDLVAMKKCIMCGITALDRRQLEVHMSSLHGVLIKANDFLGPEKSAPESKGPVPVQPKPAAPNTASTPSKGKSMVRNNLCVFCQIQFADNIQLTMHCIKIHATCSACGMVVASSKHLQNHHCKKMMRDCDICGLKKLAPDAYAVHIKKHVKPCSVSVDKMTEKAVESTKENIKKNYKPAVISLDSDSGSESDVELVVDGDEKENNEKKGIKKNHNTDKKSDYAEIQVGEEKYNSNEKGADQDETGRLNMDESKNKDVEESSDEYKNINTESDLHTEDESSQNSKDDHSKSKFDDIKEPHLNSASNIEQDQSKNRKRRNSSDDMSDSDDPKRQKTELENSETEAHGFEDISDSESRDKNVHQSMDSSLDTGDKVEGTAKRSHSDDDIQDRATESVEANKRQKILKETE